MDLVLLRKRKQNEFLWFLQLVVVWGVVTGKNNLWGLSTCERRKAMTNIHPREYQGRMKGKGPKPFRHKLGQLRKCQGIKLAGKTSYRKMWVWRYQRVENLRPKWHVVVSLPSELKKTCESRVS